MFNVIVRCGRVLLCVRDLLTLLSPTTTSLVNLQVLLLKTLYSQEINNHV